MTWKNIFPGQKIACSFLRFMLYSNKKQGDTLLFIFHKGGIRWPGLVKSAEKDPMWGIM